MKQKRRTHTYRYLLTVLGVIFLIAVFISSGVYKVQVTSVTIKPTITYKDTSSKNGKPLAWPSVGQAAIGAVGFGVLEDNGVQTPAPTASVAKLITALCVLQVKPLHGSEPGPVVPIGPTDLALYTSYVAQGGSVVPVNSGEQLTERQALEAILLPSANNIADSLAIWAFGSLHAYSMYANSWLAKQGIVHTHVGTDASGLSPTSTSTARDLVRIGILSAQEPVIASVSAESTAELPVVGTVHNVNWLLGTNGINGLKTGNSDAAGGVYVFSSTYKVSSQRTVTSVGAVMQAPTLQKAMDSSASLLVSSQQALVERPAVVAGQVIGQYTLPDSHIATTAIASKEVSALFWRGKLIDTPRVVLGALQPPKSAGTLAGTINFGNQPSQTSTVILSAPLPSTLWWYRLLH